MQALVRPIFDSSSEKVPPELVCPRSGDVVGKESSVAKPSDSTAYMVQGEGAAEDVRDSRGIHEAIEVEASSECEFNDSGR